MECERRLEGNYVRVFFLFGNNNYMWVFCLAGIVLAEEIRYGEVFSSYGFGPFVVIPPESGFLAITATKEIVKSLEIRGYLKKNGKLIREYQGDYSIIIPSEEMHGGYDWGLTVLNSDIYSLLLLNIHSQEVTAHNYTEVALPDLHQAIFYYPVLANTSYIDIFLYYDIPLDPIPEFKSVFSNNNFIVLDSNFGKVLRIKQPTPIYFLVICSFSSNFSMIFKDQTTAKVTSELTVSVNPANFPSFYLYEPLEPYSFLISLSEFSGNCEISVDSSGIIRKPGAKYFKAIGDKAEYKIFVNCSEDSEYLLAIVHNNRQNTRMKSGISYVGEIFTGENMEYFVALGQFQNVSIVLAVNTGKAVGCIQSCKGACTENQYFCEEQQENAKFIQEFFEITEEIPSEYVFIIKCKGESACEYQITAVINHSAQVIKANIPTYRVIPYYGDALFTFIAKRTSFRVTSIAGDCFLYVFAGENCQKSSENCEIDIFSNEKNCQNRKLDIIVRASGAARFFLTAYDVGIDENSAVLVNTHGFLSDSLVKGEFEYRYYYLRAELTEIRLQLLPITGEFLISFAFSNNIPNTELMWQVSESYSLEIPERTPENQTYLLKISGKSFELLPKYTLLCETANSATILKPYTSFSGYLNAKSYNLYTIPLTSNHENIYFTVSSNSPIKISAFFLTSPLIPSTLSLNLTYSDYQLYCPCITNSISYNKTCSHCDFFISLHSESFSPYEIFFYSQAINFTTILYNREMIYFLGKSERYIGYITGSMFDTEVQVISYQGNLNFNVKLYPYPESEYLYTIKWPSEENYDYHLQVLNGNSENLTLFSFDMWPEKNTYLVLVIYQLECLSENCRIFTSQEHNYKIEVLEGKKYSGSILKGKIAHFHYYHGSDMESMAISLTSICGDPDIYVTKGNNNPVTENNYNWKATHERNDTLVIYKNDTFFSEKNSIKGDYDIVVYGFTSTKFILEIKSGVYQIIPLSPGVAYNTLVGYLGLYFSYDNKLNTNLLVTISGDILVYINKYHSGYESVYTNLPSKTSYSWSFSGNSKQNTFIIPHNSTGFCISCTFLIAVYPQTPSNISITIRNQYSFVKLLNGIPHESELLITNWDYYCIYIDHTSELTFSLLSYSGNTDMFIDTNEEITFQSAKWRSISKEGLDHVQIFTNDPNFQIGYYYIGVYGMNKSSYSIVANIRKSVTEITPSVLHKFAVGFQENLYFAYKFSSNLPQNLVCSIKLLRGLDDIHVYVLLTSQEISASTDNFTYKYKGRNIEINIEVERLLNAQFTLHSNSEFQEFELLCNNYKAVVALDLNTLLTGDFELQRTTRMYKVNVKEKAELRVFLIPCEGLQSLELASESNIQNLNDPDIYITKPTDGKLIAVLNKAIGNYYITVRTYHSIYNISSYEISSMTSPYQEIRVGKITAFPSENSIVAKWEVPYYENLTEVQVSEYLVFLSTTDSFENLCGLRKAEYYNDSTLVARVHEQFISLDLDGKIKNLYVVAMINLQINGVGNVLYKSIRIQETNKEKYLGFIEIFMLVTCIIIFVTALILRRRTNKIQMEIEMATRNIQSTEKFSNLNYLQTE